MDLDFAELFAFIISLGAGRNSYVPEFITFGEKFVDSKLRRLRLGAFAVANKLPDRFRAARSPS